MQWPVAGGQLEVGERLEGQSRMFGEFDQVVKERELFWQGAPKWQTSFGTFVHMQMAGQSRGNVQIAS
jgi:hypothetical protein